MNHTSVLGNCWCVESMKDDEIKDVHCDPDHPVSVTFEEVSAAAFKIHGGIEMTPCNVCTEYFPSGTISMTTDNHSVICFIESFKLPSLGTLQPRGLQQ